MEPVIVTEPTVVEMTQLNAALEDIFREIESCDEKIRCNQSDIDALKVETKAILQLIKANL